MKIRSIIDSVLRNFPGSAHWWNLPAFCGAVAFAAGISVANCIPVPHTVLTGTLYFFLPVLATGVCTAALFCGKAPVRLSAFLVAGAAVTLLHLGKWERCSAVLQTLQSDQITVSGILCNAPAPQRDRFVWLLRLQTVNGNTESPLCGRTFMCVSSVMPDAAGAVSARGYISAGRSRTNRYDFDEKALLRVNGISGKINVTGLLGGAPPKSWHAKCSAWFRTRVIGVLKTYPDPDHRAVIRASFLDEKAYLAPEIKNAFRTSGLYHLLSLSGLHAGILLTAVYLLLSMVPVPARVRHLCALSVLWFYYLYIGPVPSLARATVMATVVIVSLLLQRKSYPLQSLGLAAIIWLAWSPASLFQAGFQFSFLATFGILTLHPVIMKAFPGHSNPVVDYGIRLVLIPFSVSFSAFCATLPAMLWHFGTVSLYGFVANIVGAGLMTGGMWLFFIGLLSAPLAPFISHLAVYYSSLFLDGLMSVANFSVSMPLSSVELPAPYPEQIAAWYLLFAALVTVSTTARRTVLKWGIPVLCCFIPAGYLVRRATAGTQVVGFTGGTPGVEVTAVRSPSGSTVLFCNGGEETVDRFIHYSVTPWIRHMPGTRVCRRVTVTPENDYHTGVAENDGHYRFTEKKVIVVTGGDRSAPPCTCSYDATGQVPQLEVVCGDVMLSRRKNRFSWFRSADKTRTAGRSDVPTMIELKDGVCRVLPFD
ncbi:MAG: ComEC/Rec2 family competence protein [Chitinispirillaceae bacterium]|nr:ComEC/Rec2 family competence protein [Chitinispirillaceae bacterium]